MECVIDLKSNYAFDPQHSWNFNTSNNPLLKDVSLSVGASLFNRNLGRRRIKVYIDVETPNFTFTRFQDYQKTVEIYDLIFALCPYTCKMLNEIHNTNKFVPIYFFINSQIFPEPNTERNINVLYVGHFLGLKFLPYFIDTMNILNGKEQSNKLLTVLRQPIKETFERKLRMLGNTKICLVHNLLSLDYFFHRENYPSLFSKYYPSSDEKRVPQCKSRIFEGAAMGCILLCLKDEYNIIEEYFTENEDFLYFSNEEELKELSTKIVNNYNEYKFLGVNARRKCLANYTQDNFINELINELKKKSLI